MNTRLLNILLGLVASALLTACDFWPQELKTLAESISGQVSGETTAWLASGDVVVINVEGSPLYEKSQPELEAIVTGLAEQTIEFSATPLESIAITFYSLEGSDDPEQMRQFIFLVLQGRPVLQPVLDMDATGSLKPEEFQTSLERLGDSLSSEQQACVLSEVKKRAAAAGDPETLDPESVEFLTAQTWLPLDAFGKRIILVQALTTQALFYCADQ